MKFASTLSSLAALAFLCHGQSTFSPARPPAIPLAVKSPYMNTWLQAGSDGGNGGYLAGEWPTFWAYKTLIENTSENVLTTNRGQITGWAGIIRVDGNVYTWLGAPSGPPLVNQSSFSYTSTRSIFTQSVSGVQIVTTFLSPVNPNDYQRASLPFSYMNVEVSSIDGNAHNVQLYTDISAEWVAGDRTAVAQWDYGTIGNGTSTTRRTRAARRAGALEQRDLEERQKQHHVYGTETQFEVWTSVQHPHPATTTSHYQSPTPTIRPHAPSPFFDLQTNNSSPGGIAYHKVYRQTPLLLSETNDQAEWGNWYYATDNVATLTHQSGADVNVRGQFIDNGLLDNSADPNYRAINDAYPVFGFAKDLGNVTSSVDTLFMLSLNQETAVQFEGANGNVSLPSLWTSYFLNDQDAVSFFYDDYDTESTMATNFDNKVAVDSAAAGGSDYLTATSLAARQAFAAVELTNTPDTPYLFLKEISSDGNVNTVDVIFPAMPIFLYTNPTLLKLLLDPLFINQEAGFWPKAFPIHDIGAHFPNATGHNDGNAEPQPLEEGGNMVIMTLAYAQRSGDTAYLSQHYDILRQWTEYLVEEALIPADQISTDDFAGSLANQTNLALKGIIGIDAMAEIANLTGNTDDAANYTNIAQSYIEQWTQLGVAMDADPPHTTLAYGQNDTHGLLYNLYADALLSLSLVPSSIYTMQSDFYPTVALEYGVPLDTRHNYTKGDWELFVAAIAEQDTQELFTRDIANWINTTPTSQALTDLYDTISGDFPDTKFVARPVVGGFFSLLALPEGYVPPSGGGSSTGGGNSTTTASSAATSSTSYGGARSH